MGGEDGKARAAAYMRAWQAANPDKVREYRKIYKQRHPEQYRAQRRRAKARRRERLRALRPPKDPEAARERRREAKRAWRKAWYKTEKGRAALKRKRQSEGARRRSRAREARRRLKWQREHPEEARAFCAERIRKWRQTPQGRAQMQKDRAKRRGKPKPIALNRPFPGADGHHINERIVVYIPASIHGRILHATTTGKGMATINHIAERYLFASREFHQQGPPVSAPTPP